MKTGKSSTTIPIGSTPINNEQDSVEKVATFYFYVLKDPRDNKIKYVGRTVDMKNRFRNHIYEAKKFNKNKRERWIMSLLRRNMQPIMKCIYKLNCDIDEAILTEKMLVKTIGKRFELKNSPDNYLGAVCTGTPVYQYCKNTGKKLNSFANANQAMIITKTQDDAITKSCKNFMIKPQIAGDCFWSYIDMVNYPMVEINKWHSNNGGKIVNQYSIDGIFINQFISTHEADRHTGISYKKISACCLNKQKHAGGYIWKYVKC